MLRYLMLLLITENKFFIPFQFQDRAPVHSGIVVSCYDTQRVAGFVNNLFVCCYFYVINLFIGTAVVQVNDT